MNQGQIPVTATTGAAPSARTETPFTMQLAESLIPRDVLNLIPEFSGETNLLSLFLRKCEYVIEKYQGTTNRNEFLMQNITSKLKGKAAALISERGDFETYSELKSLLIQHFGDPRSEECVAIELETLKIKQSESYLQFCSRIQDIRAVLISKVNQNSSTTLREAKKIIYNNTSLNVFMYNLPEHMVRIVRIKNPTKLEEALKYVLEEVNFQEQYNLRSKMLQHRPQGHMLPSRDRGFVFNSPNLKPFSTSPLLQNNNYRPFTNQTQFKFGIPNQNFVRPNIPNQQIGQQQMAQFGQPVVDKKNPQQLGFRPQVGMFAYRPPTAQIGYRPQIGQFGYRPVQASAYRPTNNFYDSDATMRTAPAAVKPQQGFPLNELYTDNEQYYYDVTCDDYMQNMTTHCDYDYTNMNTEDVCVDERPSVEVIDTAENLQSTNNNSDPEAVQNFQIHSIQTRRK